MLKSSDGVEYSLPSVSGAVNVTEGGDVLNEIEETFDEVDVMIARMEVEDEIVTNAEELAAVSGVVSSEVEAAVDTTAKDAVEEPVGDESEITCITNTVGDVDEGPEELIEGGYFVWNAPHLMHGFTPGVIDLEEELREKDERRVRELAEHEKSEAEGSSTLPPVMEILQLNNETEPVLDDTRH